MYPLYTYLIKGHISENSSQSRFVKDVEGDEALNSGVINMISCLSGVGSGSHMGFAHNTNRQKNDSERVRHTNTHTRTQHHSQN